MKSSNKTCLFATLFAFVLVGTQGATALAVIGETEAELIKRYGKPDAVLDKDVAPADKLIAWSDKAGCEKVIICLIDGESVHEVFELKRPVEDRQDKVISRILADNSEGEQWRPLADEQMAGYNTLQGMKGEPALKYVWSRRSNDWKAFVLKGDPKHFEVNSPVWPKAVQANR